MPGNTNYWSPGTNNFFCQECGRKGKAFEAKTRWDNLIVCSDCYNSRQPQDFSAVIRPERPPSIISPRVDIFPDQCDVYHSQAIPGIGLPGCMIPNQRFVGAFPTYFIGEPPIDETER